jgi:hypothetical protein
MLNDNEYEVQITVEGILYNVTCDLYDSGVWIDLPQTDDDPGGFEIVKEPEFYNWCFVDWDSEQEIHPTGHMFDLAKAVVNEQYWNLELWG